jgi:uncharacterized protein (DUF983 family)
MNPILYSVSKNKCPRCHQGDVFVHGHAYKKGFDQMHTHCSNCHLKYEKEPGFFYGAMYVSYALGVALFVTLWVSFNLFFINVSIGWQIGSIIFASILLAPYLYALSKIEVCAYVLI